jgi:hypothetical protein
VVTGAGSSSATLRSARAAYFAANGFGDDGGYGKRWEIVKLGPLPIPIRNVAGRMEALRFHDLHHLLTGYSTDLAGEGHIAAWELASGCAGKWFAWLINFQGLGLGLAVSPRETFAAFVRGRHTKNLYDRNFDEALLDRTVTEVATQLGLRAPPPDATLGDVVAFGLWSSATVVVHVGLVVGVAIGLWRLVTALACG